MVERHTYGPPVVVVDLDGTLVRCNTFHRYIAFILSSLLKRGRVKAVAGVMRAMLGRVMPGGSHAAMKHKILAVTAPYADADMMKRFASGLSERFNKTVKDMLDSYRNQGALILLATAAPECYALPLSETVSLSGCVTTGMPRGDEEWSELKGSRKAEAVKAWVREAGGHIATVITDHHDDIPLLKINEGDNYLVAPSKRSVVALRDAGIRFNSL